MTWETLFALGAVVVGFVLAYMWKTRKGLVQRPPILDSSLTHPTLALKRDQELDLKRAEVTALQAELGQTPARSRYDLLGGDDDA